MPCFHPLTGFKTGLKTENGKDDIFIIRGHAETVTLDFVNRRNPEVKFNPDYMHLENGDAVLDQPIQIPCGNCVGCRLEYSRQWAVRCCLEASYYQDNCFVTLTYDDAHLPKDKHVHKEDMQKFMKRLRAHFPENVIRFFGCGEYGEIGHRPHYHLILFNVGFPDKRLDRITASGNYVYRSAILEKLWPFGYSSIGEVNFKTAAYVARYVMKKRKGKDTTDEFCLMSRRPGIGFDYFQDNFSSIYTSDKIFLGSDIPKSQPPKYFDKLLDGICPDQLELTKEWRRYVAEVSTTSEMVAHDFEDVEDLNEWKEDFKKRQIERLRRQ